MSAQRRFLEQLYDVAVAAAQPRSLVEDAVAALRARADAPRRVSVIALGKAAPAMATAAVDSIQRLGGTIAGGIVVGVDDGPAPHARMLRVAGDHPVPGARSREAARLVGDAARAAHNDSDAALVLLSGGTTSLVGAPVDGVESATLDRLYDALLGSGWDIDAMNAVRKRFLRWGAGRLAAGLAPLPVHLVLLSDVIGDDPATIGSGPCSPDPTTAGEILRRLKLLPGMNASTVEQLARHLETVARAEIPETPKPGDRVFDRVAPPIIRGNSAALAAIGEHARRAGWITRVVSTPLRGEARERGVEIARELLAAPAHEPLCIIHGGETTVTLSSHRAGFGGRCQELALAAARVLAGDSSGATSIALLAAGTDGRDGPTDAAGAMVDRDTWHRSAANGGAPDRALAEHDSHRALAAAGALLSARVTGTNVMDIVVGLANEH